MTASPTRPDTLVVVEPSVGSVARSKGHLYLLVTSRISLAPRARGDAPGGRDDPERVLLRRVGRDPGLPPEGDRDGQQAARPPGGPARAQDDRRQRPDRHRRRGRARQRDVRRDGRAGRGLPDPPGPPLDPARPASRARPAVGRPRAGRLAGRDLGRRFARARLPERRGQARPRRAQGRDADPPPAVGDGAPPPPVRGRGRLRQRRGDRLRGDRGVVDEPGADASSRSARPEPLAGAPGPLADPARRQRPGRGDGRVSAAAGSAKLAAGGALGRVVGRVQDLLPRRKPAYRRVTPLASRRETQRRAALALLALVVVVGGLGLAVYAFGGNTPQQAHQLGQRRSEGARRGEGATWPR